MRVRGRRRARSAAPEGSDKPSPTSAFDLSVREAEIVGVFTRLLMRDPRPDEVAHHTATLRSVRELLDVVVASEEFAKQHLTPPPPVPHVVNVWHPELAQHGHPVGTTSDDGVTMVGRDGWLFLVGGTNSVLAQHRGDTVMPDGWLASWQAAQAQRSEGADRLGARFVGVVVPDKLATLSQHFPENLPEARAPAAELAADPAIGLLYPVAELRAVNGGGFLRTDSHLSLRGSTTLAAVVATALGVVDQDLSAPADTAGYLSSGDLGSRLLPPVVEVMPSASGFGAATLVEDNHQEIAAVGGHIGTRRVLRNERAADPRTVVVFGDSYAFPAPHHQGLAWHLAQRFREVHFVWIPYGWDADYAAQARADAVVCETAERFVVRPPAPSVDVLALAAQTLERRRGLSLEETDARPDEPDNVSSEDQPPA